MSALRARILGSQGILVGIVLAFVTSGVAQSQEAAPLSPVTVSPLTKKKRRSINHIGPGSTRRVASTTSRQKRKHTQPTPATPASAATPVAPVLNGSVAAGYRVGEITNLGPFQGLKVQDTPFTINIISSDFIQNTQSYASPDKIIDMLPGVQYTYTGERPVTGVANFRGSPTASGQQRVDGLPVASSSSLNFLEPFERVEALSSVSGFFYGVNPATGIFNYVLKRPLPEPFFADVTTGVLVGTSPYAHIDTGGQTSDGKIGYRLNSVGQVGDTYNADEPVHKYSVAGTTDVHLSDSALLQLDASHSEWTGTIPALWSLASGVNYSQVAVPDPSKLWSQPWTYYETHDTMGGANLRLDLTDNWTSRTAVRIEDNEYSWNQINNTINANRTTYNQTIVRVQDYDQHNVSGYQYFDTELDTGIIHQKITFGVQGSWYDAIAPMNYSAAKPNAYTNLPLASPTYLPEQNLTAGTLPTYHPTTSTILNAVVGDQIDLGKHWSALLGVTRAEVNQTTNSTSNVATSYDASKFTPSAALLFKPTDKLTAYVSYVEGLQQGIVVSGTQFTNNGAILPPYLRQQYEAGAKATISNVLYSIAFFDIDSALQYSVDNHDGTFTYVQSGRQQNKGVDTSATGELLPGLRLLGGISYVDARVKVDAATPAYVGKEVQGAAKWLYKSTVEYDLPFVDGLTLQGGAYYTSGFYADQLNTNWVEGHTTFDLGIRYATKIEGHPAIARFNVSNITDARYWTSTATVGEPRRFAGTLEIKY